MSLPDLWGFLEFISSVISGHKKDEKQKYNEAYNKIKEGIGSFSSHYSTIKDRYTNICSNDEIFDDLIYDARVMSQSSLSELYKAIVSLRYSLQEIRPLKKIIKEVDFIDNKCQMLVTYEHLLKKYKDKDTRPKIILHESNGKKNYYMANDFKKCFAEILKSLDRIDNEIKKIS